MIAARTSEAYVDQYLANRPTHRSLERPFYTAPEVFSLEKQRLFSKWWLFVGPQARIPNEGDYYLYELDELRLIIVRTKHGVSALHNVCRHRGSALCTRPSGHVGTLQCPYHAWTYDTTGKLLHAPRMAKDFQAGEHSLFKAHVEVVEGLIFVSVAQQPPDFSPAREELTRMLAPYQLATAKLAFSREYILDANWKLLLENAAECYHCGPAHPQYISMMIGAAALANPALRAEDERRNALLKPRWEAAGLHCKPHAVPPENTWCLSCREPMREGYVTQSRDGRPLAPLLGRLQDPDAGVVGVLAYPTFQMEVCSDHAVPIRLRPISATQTAVCVDWLVRGDAQEGRDYDLERLTWFFEKTGEQDWKLVSDQQLGLTSEHYTPGPFSELEDDTEFFLSWYSRRMLAQRARPVE